MRVQSSVTLSVAFAVLVLCGTAFADTALTTCGQSISTPGERYYLTGPISTGSDFCLTVGADNVVIDCQGNSITDSASATTGVYASHRNNITVKNCNILGFASGIMLDYSTYCNITGNMLSGARDTSLWLRDGGNHTVSSNFISILSSARMDIIFSSSDNVIFNNTLVGTNTVSYAQAYSDGVCRNNVFYWNNFTYTAGTNVVDNCANDLWNGSLYGVNEGNVWWNVMDSTVHVYGAAPSGFSTGLYVGSGGSGYPYNNANSGYHVGGLTDYSPLTPAIGCSNLNTAGASYTLSSDISISGSTCFSVNADDVAIDCAGHSITGDDTDRTYGIRSSAFNTTIKNCVISRFSTAVYFGGATNGTIQNVTANTTLSQWGGDGSTGDGIAFSGATGNTITGSRANSQNSYSIRIYGGSSNNTIKDSTATANYYALEIDNSPGNTVANSTVSANDWSMDIRSSYNTVMNTTFISPSGSGRLLTINSGASGNTFCWNNFTATSSDYADDENGGNYYNSTLCNGEGNLWANVLSGSVDVRGTVHSVGFPSIYIGSNGTGLPYSYSTSGGKVVGVTDYVPITPIHDGPAYIDGCAAISSPGEYRLNQSISGGYMCFDIEASNVSIDCQGNTITSTGSPYLVALGYVSNVSFLGCNFAGGSFFTSASASSVRMENVNITGAALSGFYFFDLTLNHVLVNASGAVAFQPYAMYGSLIANSTFISDNMPALSIPDPHSGDFRGTTIVNNTFISGGSAVIALHNGGDNLFALNNFTCSGACALYINDTTGNNQYDATVDGIIQGNIYPNVASGAVDVRGDEASSIPGLYVGSTGSGYPYTGAGMTVGVTDNAPLTARRICDHYIGQADVPATLSDSNSVYCLNESVATSSTAIDVAASGVTIDCRGHTIAGDSTGSQSAVYSAQAGTILGNCGISGYYYGIYFYGSSNGQVSDVNVSGAHEALRLEHNSGNNRLSNIVASATDDALGLQDQSNGNTISNLAATAGGHAIAFYDAHDNLLYNNTLSSTGGESSDEAYFDNFAHNNTFYWNTFTDTSGHYVQDNHGGNFFDLTRDQIDVSAFDNSLVSWYRAEGNANDELGNNIGAWSGMPAYSTGHFGQAFSFDGTGSGNISIPDSPSLNPGAITISAWIYITGSPESYPSIACKSNMPGSVGYCLHVINGNQVKFWINDGSHYVQSQALPLNTWVNVVGEYDTSMNQINLYINGERADDRYYASPIIPSGDPLTIGNYPYSGTDNGLFEGLIDNVAIFNESLSDAQVAALYNSSYNRGNIWANVVSGEVNITGNEPSAYGSNWLVGSGGSGYPYSSTTSGGKVTSNVVDYAPLMSRCSAHIQLAGGSDPVTLDCANTEYTLLGNIDVSSTTAVNIDAPNVTLDCNGYSITESDWSWNNGMFITSSGATVKNCNISNFGDGIYTVEAPSSAFFYNNFSNNFRGIELDGSDGNLLEHNIFAGNRYGMNMYSSGNMIQYNEFTDNDEYGVYLSSSSNNVLQYNNFTHNNYGFYVYYSDNNQILYNNIINTTQYNFGDSGSSCPFIYPWNGSAYVFGNDFSTSGRLTTLSTGPKKTYDDYSKIPGAALRTKNGSYSLQLAEEYDEISYIDELALLTVDHSPDYSIYNGFLAANKSTIYTVENAALRSPVSCTDEHGQDCLPQISALDGVYTTAADNATPKAFNIDLGNLSGAQQVKLVLAYARAFKAPVNINKSVQVMGADGTWRTTFANKDLISPADSPNTFVLDMTGQFAGNYSIRLLFPMGLLDYVAIDTSPQQPITVSRYSPESADLHYRGHSEKIQGDIEGYDYSRRVNMLVTEPSGNFTSYGNVTGLLASSDDMYAIMSSGDEITAGFAYNAPQDGLARDFLAYSRYYYKPAKEYSGNYSVYPLPFQAMSKYPYPASEHYPNDAAHSQYLSERNIRPYTMGNASSAGGSLPYSYNNTVSGNTINGGPDSYGLYFYQEQDSSATNNTISNVKYGIYLYEVSSESATMNISQNHISHVSESGIYMDHGYNGVAIWNNTVDNAMTGININYGSEYNTITANSIRAGNQPVWFDNPTYIANGSDGYLYLSDSSNYRIMRIDPTAGTASLVAGGNDSANYNEGHGAAAAMSDPRGLAFGPDGYLYFADRGNNMVRKINVSTNTTYLVAGNTRYGNDDGIGDAASFASPMGLAFGPDGLLYVIDNGESALRAINVSTSEVTTPIGSGFNYPYGIAFGQDGYLYASNAGSNTVDKVNVSTGASSTLATGFDFPMCLAFGPDGYLYLSDTYNGRIVKIDASSGDYDEVASGFNYANGLAFAADGYLYVVDTGAYKVMKVDTSSGDISTAAGTGTEGYLASPWQLVALRIADSGYNTISGNTFASESGPATFLINSPQLEFTNNTLSALNGKGIWISSNVFNSSFVGNNITASTWVDEGDPGMCTGDFTPCDSIETEAQCGNQYGCSWSIYGTCTLDYGEQTCIQIRNEAECTRSISCTWSPDADSFNDSGRGNIYYFADGTPSWSIYDISSGTGGSWADMGSALPFSASLNRSTCTAQAEATNCTNSEFYLNSVDGWPMIGQGDAPFDDNWETGMQPTSDVGTFEVAYGIPDNHGQATVRVASNESSADYLLPAECYLDGVRIRFTTSIPESQINVSCYNWYGNYVQIGQLNGSSTFNEQEITWPLKSPPWMGGGEDWHPYVGSGPVGCLNLSDESTWGGRISYTDECDLSEVIFGSSYYEPCYYAQSSFEMCPGQYDSHPIVVNRTDTTIDCAGSTLTGNGSTLGIITSQSGTVVKNCILQNFTIGISMWAQDEYSRGDSVSNTTINLTDVPDCSIYGSLCAGMVVLGLNESNFTGITIDARSPDPGQPSLYLPLVAEEVENLTFENIVSNSNFDLGLIFLDAPGTVLSNVTSVTSYDGPSFIPYYGAIALLGAPNSVIRNVTGTSGYMGFMDMASPNTTFADSSFSGASTDFLIDDGVCSGSFTNVNGSNGLPILVYSAEGQAISGVNASMIALCGANYSRISDSVVNNSGIQIYDTSFANITNVSSISPLSYTLFMQGSTGIRATNNTLREGTADCTYYGTCHPAFYAQDGSDNAFFGNEIFANYWVGGSNGSVTFNGSTSGNKYYLYDGTPAAAFCDIRSSTLTWADGGADLPFSNGLSCLLDSDSNSRWPGDGADYYPYVGACSPQMDITSLPANLTCANAVYTLRGNFTVEPTDTNVITVVANNVTVDCAGNSINGQGSQFGIYSMHSRTHVKNCDLRDFNWASIKFTSSSYDGVENTYADDGKSGIIFENVNDSYIRNSTGLGMGDYGIYLDRCSRVNITNSTGTVADWNYGIYLASSQDTVLENCTAYSGGSDAMAAYNSPRTVMTGCSLTTDGNRSSALNMYDDGSELRTDNGTFTRNSFTAKGSGSTALMLQAVGTGGNTFLDNTFTSDRWVVSYSEDENFFNNSLKGNRYYFSNGKGAWEVYNISSSANGSWADQGSDLPFGSALPSPGTYLLEQYVDGSPSGWVNNSYVNDQDWSTGSVPETESAHLTKFYPAPSSTPRNISVKVGTDLGTIVLPVPGDGYDGITTRIDILSHLEPAQVAVYYFNHSTGIFGEFQLLYEINGTSRLNESSIIWTLDMHTPWFGNDVDWHPHLVPRPNVYGNGSSIHTSGSGSLSNVTATIDGDPHVNGTEQDDVKIVNISNSGLPLFVFTYNFTGSELNFSQVSIEAGTDASGNAYASISGIPPGSIVGGKTLYMHNANTAINSVCVKDEEGAVYTAISATCTGSNEHTVACDGASHDGYTCTYDGTTAVITGLQHSAAIQFASSTPAPPPSPSGGNSNGGGSVGGVYIPPTVAQQPSAPVPSAPEVTRPPVVPTAPANPEEPSIWVPRKLPATSAGQQSAGATGASALPPETPSILGFAAMLGAVAVVAGGVLFFAWKGRKKKQGL